MTGSDLDDAVQSCLSGPKGQVVLDWIVQQLRDTLPMTRGSEYSGTDSKQMHFLDGRASAFLEILERSGNRITHERMPDNERIDSSSGTG